MFDTTHPKQRMPAVRCVPDLSNGKSVQIERHGRAERPCDQRDPGIAWPEWDCRVLAGLPALRSLGRPLYVGVSRKSFIGVLAGAPDPADRLPGTLAATAAAVLGGAHVIRAHDVAETAQAVRIAQAIRRAGAEGA